METILYVGGGERGHALVSRAGVSRQLGPGEAMLLRRGSHAPWSREYLIRYAADSGAATSFIEAGGVDLIVIDERGLAWQDGAQSLTARLCAALSSSGHVALRERVFVLLGPGARGVEHAFALGRLPIAAVLCDPEPDELFGRMEAWLGSRKGGKVALCLGGGGIEGLIYEIGVLRALEAFLPDRQIADFDMFCGISAGAFLGAFLANGVAPDEILRGLGAGSGRIDRVERGDIFDLNLRELRDRLWLLALELGQPKPRLFADALLRAAPAGLFAGKRLEAYLEQQLTRPGMTNAFSQLRRSLYIGVTDQDNSEHTVLGLPGLMDVPISRAVRASSALTPFYPPVRIKDRYYIDGGFTRTANLTIAVQHGARLVVVVDPLIPVVAEPGYVRARGGVFEAVQGLKAFTQSRFKRSLAKFRELHPEVDVIVFAPEGDETRLLSGTMMRYFYRLEVQEIAFESTIRKVRSHFQTLARDFGRHGLLLRDPRDVYAARPGAWGALDRGRLAAAI